MPCLAAIPRSLVVITCRTRIKLFRYCGRNLLGALFLFLLSVLWKSQQFVSSMPRRSQSVTLKGSGIGTKHQLLFHHYGLAGTERAYIQASLHADELPGLLVVHHLLAMLEEAEQRHEIVKEVVVVPYANPIGLNQQLLHNHLGRFSLASGVNFNRNWPDLTDAVANRVDGQLLSGNEADDSESNNSAERHNVAVIRAAMLEEIAAMTEPDPHSPIASAAVGDVMKRELLQRAITADVVLDLHCDTDAVMHLYTHDLLWPQLSDLAAELGTHCQLLDSDSGGKCFDEVCSFPWAKLAARFPNKPIPMACQSTTVELRGQCDVDDELALRDAKAIYRFLQRRGYILSSDGMNNDDSDGEEINSSEGSSQEGRNVEEAKLSTEDMRPAPPLKRDATPLTGVDMIKAQVAGVVVWKVAVGDEVHEGQVLGEIVCIEDPFAPRHVIITHTAGVVYSKRKHHLAVPGDIIIKVAGKEPLPWRKGNLLTSR